LSGCPEARRRSDSVTLFFSHVRRRRVLAGEGLLRLSVGQTVKTWSLMEALISVVDLIFVLLLGLVV
jgi:gluconate:H+ symporter, GntP family